MIWAVIAAGYVVLLAVIVGAVRVATTPEPPEFHDIAELHRQEAARRALARATRTEDR